MDFSFRFLSYAVLRLNRYLCDENQWMASRKRKEPMDGYNPPGCWWMVNIVDNLTLFVADTHVFLRIDGGDQVADDHAWGKHCYAGQGLVCFDSSGPACFSRRIYPER